MVDKITSEKDKIHCIYIVFGPLAQLVEQLTLNQRVAGSNPARPTIYQGERGSAGLKTWVSLFEVPHAKVAELVDALALGASGATRGSSSLPFRTSYPVR